MSREEVVNIIETIEFRIMFLAMKGRDQTDIDAANIPQLQLIIKQLERMYL